MSEIRQFLRLLVDRGIQVSAVDGQLKINAPKGALTPELIEGLRNNKQDILAFMSQAGDPSSKQSNQIQIIDRSQPLPLSYAQRRLWFLDQLEESNSTAYNIPQAMAMHGELSVIDFERVLNTIRARHEVLRSRFETSKDGPITVIGPMEPVPLQCSDLSAFSGQEQQIRLDEILNREANFAFNLATEPPARFHLIRLALNHHVLSINLHHILSDGWSTGVMIRELATLYDAFIQDHESPLPVLPLQYVDFAAYQRAWLDSDAMRAQLDFWRKQLQNAPFLLDLPCDNPRPPMQSFSGAAVKFQIDGDTVAKLEALAANHQASLFMCMQAALTIFLARYTGQNDLLIGTAVANRQRPELENLIGFFVNMLVLRGRISGNPDYRNFLIQTRNTVMDAFTRQDVPFETIVDALQPPRSLGYNPIFQVMFLWRAQEDERLRLPGLTLEPMPSPHVVAKVDLTLSLSQEADGISGHFEYATALFLRETVTRMANEFTNLVTHLAQDPDRLLSHHVLPRASDLAIMADWNQTFEPNFTSPTVVEMFDQKAAQQPEMPALTVAEETWSYGALKTQADRIAGILAHHGAKPGTRVIVCLDRTPMLPAALLGVMKTGAAYVPVDPDFPRQRIALMVERAGADVILSERAFESFLPNALMIEDVGSETFHFPARKITSEYVAYVIFTSGTTGIPKGIAISHGALSNFLKSMAQSLEFTAADTLTAVTTISFDIAALELYLPLMAGARVVLADRETAVDARALADLLDRQNATVMQATPATWRMLADAGWSGRDNMLLLSGGEALPADLASLLVTRGRALWNLYGPTETTIWSAARRIHPGLSDQGTCAIGGAIANTELHVVDPWLNYVPFGVTGSLLIGGLGLALGYVDQPRLTAEKFIPDPFSHRKGSRLYATGDQVRLRTDGTMTFLGRGDNQVKLRGYRIELGDIESCLRGHASVKQAAVLLREDVPGHPRLVAYIEPQHAPTGVQAESAIDANELKQFASITLPDYMVPSIFVALASFPLTPNGKLNRRTLPAPGAHAVVDGGDRTPPRNETESILLAIWEDVLQVSDLGIHTDFFAAGGHSLLAMRAMIAIRERLSTDIPLRGLFQHPTPAELGRFIDTDSDSSDTLPAITASNKPPRLSPAQERLWFLQNLEHASAGNALAYTVPLAIHLNGALDRKSLFKALATLIHRHQVLRFAFPMSDGIPNTVLLEEEAFHADAIDLRSLGLSHAESQAQQLAQNELVIPFDLETGPLVRIRLLQLETERHVLLVTFHHIVVDEGSLGIFVDEMAAHYRAAGEDTDIPTPTLQYSDFSHWQHDHREAIATQTTYWHEQLEGIPERLDLPTDFPRPSVQQFRGDQHSFQLDENVSIALREYAQSRGVTPFMLLEACYALLLSRHSDQNDVVIGTPFDLRDTHELRTVIGLFINTLALRHRIELDQSFDQFLAESKATTLAAYAHRNVPFEQVVEVLQPVRSLSHAPIFQTMFTLQHPPASPPVLPGVELSLADLHESSVKVDLILTMTDTGNGFNGTFEYSRDLFRPSSIRMMTASFQTLITGLLTAPAEPMYKAPLISNADKRMILDRLPSKSTTSWQPVIHQFENHARTSPDSVAIRETREDGWPAMATYAALNSAAESRLSQMRALGVEPGEVVATLARPSTAMVTGLLATLKAGATYLPLDIDNPAERNAWMCADAGVRIVLTRGSTTQDLSVKNVIDLDDHPWGVDQNVEEPKSILPNQTAYVIYTSGSTGRPKGVSVSHGALANLVSWHQKDFGIVPGDNASMMARVSFDASVWELWPYLAGGATICVTPRDLTLRPDALRDWVISRHIHIGFFATPLAEVLIGLPWPECTALRTMLTGGDRLRFRPPTDLPFELSNNYGPTENAVVASSGLVSPSGDELPDIGKTISGSGIALFDRWLQPVPDGMPGELCIVGSSLATGYLGLPARTALSFVPNPLATRAGERCYRTGDRARYLADGTIQFMNRLDAQIQLRGFRIEPGEIERTLQRHEKVERAALIQSAADQRLVACLTVTNQADFSLPVDAEMILSPTSLRGDLDRYLMRNLPRYMVPSLYVILPSMPLNSSGKIDRKSLELAIHNFRAPEEVVTATTPTEILLSDIWCDMLNLETIGIHTNFFQAGGHSLIAARLVARIETAFQCKLSLAKLFESPTIAELGRFIDESERSGQAQLQKVARSDSMQLSFAQERMWFLHQLEEQSGGTYNIFAALRLRGQLDVAALTKAVTDLEERQESLRQNFQVKNGQPIAVAADGARIQLMQHDQFQSHESVMDYCQNAILAPFDLANEPLVRLHLFRLEDVDHILFVNMHHIIADGWSVGVLVQDLTAFYEATVQNQQPMLEQLPIQYPDYAAWQRQIFDSETLAKELAWWESTLRPIPEPLLLGDKQRPEIQTYQGANQTFFMSADQVERIKAISTACQTTPYMTLMSIFAIQLGRLVGRRRMVIGTLTANRERSEFEPLVGNFINTLPIAIDLGQDTCFKDVVASIRQATLNAFAHATVPFEQIVAHLQADRQAEHLALAQVGFIFQNLPNLNLELPGLQIEPMALDNPTAKTDLSLSINETETTWSATFNYNTDLFSDDYVDQLGIDFIELLDALGERTDQPLIFVTEDAPLRLPRKPASSDEEHFALVHRSNLSENQILIWLGQSLHPDKPLYNNSMVVHLPLEIEKEPFFKAIILVFDAVEVLNQAIESSDGIPMARTLKPAEKPTIEYMDLSGEENPRGAFETWIQGPIEQPLPLNEALYKTGLIRLGPSNYVWFFTVHQILVDGHSFSLLADQVEEVYGQLIGAQTVQALDLPRFSECVTREKDARGQNRYRKAATFWNSQLALPREKPTFYGKPADFSDSQMTVRRHAFHADQIAKLSTFLTQYGAAEKASNTGFANVFLTAMGLFLSRIGHGSRFFIALPLHNRRNRTERQTIGPFMLPVPVLFELEQTDTVASLFQRTAKAVFKAMRHSQLPVRNPVGDPVYLTQMNYHIEQVGPFLGEPAVTQWRRGSHGDEAFSLHVSDFGALDDIEITFYFNQELFDDRECSRAVDHFLQILMNLVSNPEANAANLDLLTDDERNHLIHGLNQTEHKPFWSKPFIATFEDRVKQVPHHLAAIAIQAEDSEVGVSRTYQELAGDMNRMAAHLASQGIGHGDVVAVLAQRNTDFLAAILAILKLGAIYLPLDPAHPAERLQRIVDDASARQLLVSTACLRAEHLKDWLTKDTAFIELSEALQSQETSLPSNVVSADDTAYVIYTSGSTGMPKGAMVRHEGMLNHLAAKIEDLSITKDDVLAQNASQCFDISVWQFLAMLPLGGRVVIMDEGISHDPALLLEAVHKHDVSLLELVPSLLEMILAGPMRMDLGQLRLLIPTGEALPPNLASRWLAVHPDIWLVNAYGPTECSDDVSHYFVKDRPPASTVWMPIGKPIRNTQFYLIDQGFHLVPYGMEGELCVGGDCVGGGYLHDPRRTALAFVPDPFGSTEGARLYRTGDRVRYQADGNLIFLGRIDFQVKIRGHRIEPGEVEAALARHPEVQTALVVACKGDDGDVFLAAYASLHDGTTLENPHDVLMDFLSESLPPTMTPSALVLLDEFPLTPNGKIDRKALPSPDRYDASTAYEAPHTTTEEKLAAIWMDVLNLTRIGRHDDFFHAGGHSLLATRMMARVRETFQQELPLRSLFKASSLSEFAALIDGKGVSGQHQAIPLSTSHEPVLSFAQERMWFLQQLDQNAAGYNLIAMLHLKGHLDFVALESALNALTERHQILRTRFPAKDGRPTLSLHSADTNGFGVEDWRGLEATVQETAIKRASAFEASRPFDLGKDNLLRLRLWHLADDHVALLINMHHIISDGTSMEIWIKDLAALYHSAQSEEPIGLSPLTIQYSDFSHWQKDRLQGDHLQELESFWKDQLANIPAYLDLPIDRARPETMSWRGDIFEFDLDRQTVERLRELGKVAGVTAFITFEAAYAAFLAWLSGQKDFCIGTAVANRNHEELEPLIGLFVNTLVLRHDLTDNPNFQDLLARTRQTVLDAHAHSELPFERLVDNLDIDRDTSRTPIFQTMFAYENEAPVQPSFAGLSIQLEDIDHTSAKCDLSLTLSETAAGPRATFEYSLDLFDRKTVVRIASQFGKFLAFLSNHPSQPLLSSSIFHAPAIEKEHEPQDSLLIPETIAARVAEAADHIAVIDGNRHLSFNALWRTSGRLSRRLKAHGVRTEDVCVIMLNRGIDLVTAQLAVWMAGGVMAVVDGKGPAHRVREIAEDSGAVITIAAAEMATERLPNLPFVDPASIPDDEKVEVPARLHPGQLAYLLFTSGSTGRPKGVMIDHAALIGHLNSYWETPGFTANDRMLAQASFLFDVSIEQVWCPLVAGATVVLRGDEPWSGRELLDALYKQGVTHADLPVALWQQLMEQGSRADGGTVLPASLRWLSVGNEAVPADGLAQWMAATDSKIPLVNAYGPTETTITATTFTCREESSFSTVPIGKALPGRTTFILNDYLQPVPTGAAGELFLGGDCLARGYLQRPSQTAAVFVPDPFSGEAGARLYRTKDRVRLIDDGNILFLGRADFQIKLRGFRIEPGEIEHYLTTDQRVSRALVRLEHDQLGHARLTAYAVTGAFGNLSDELLQSMRGTLPAYMIPAALVCLEEFPLTNAGKIDRNALPKPNFQTSTRAFTAPRTPLEATLAELWSELLEPTKIGAFDNFFELGGHSLLAAQLVSRVERELGRHLPLKAIFSHPTLADQARFLESGDQVIKLESIRNLPRKPDESNTFPLSLAQQRLWILDQLEGANPAFNMSTALVLEGSLDPKALQGALDVLIERHELLRTSFHDIDGTPIQRVQPYATVPIATIDLRQVSEPERTAIRDQLIEDEATGPFDLSDGPLIRAALLRLQEDQHILLLTLHHIICDGWSVSILVRELGDAFRTKTFKPEAIAANIWPPLKVQYADFASWQREQFNQERHNQQIDYWREQLAGAPDLLPLPYDRPRPATQTFAGSQVYFELEPAVTDALKTMANQHGASLFMVLNTLFSVLLHRYSNQKDILVGTPIAGRNHPDLEALAGFFLSTLVLRARVETNMPFVELLSAVRQTALEAYENQDVPFENVVDALQINRSLSHTPLFQVLFMFQNTPPVALELETLRFSNLETPRHVTNFDLTLSMEEAATGELAGAFEYNIDLFDKTTIETLAACFVQLARGAVAHPEKKLGRLPMLPAAQRSQRLEEWNNTFHALPSEPTFSQLFENWAERDGDAIALLHDPSMNFEQALDPTTKWPKTERVSYAALNRRANRLAHALIATGIGPDDVVVLLTERGLDFMVGVLATFKAGAAYLALDPMQNPTHTERVLTRCNASLILTQAQVAQDLESRLDVATPIHAFEQLAEQTPEEKADLNPQSRAVPDNLAYLIFTSGSTGIPKGAMITQRGMINHLYAKIEDLDMGSQDRVAQNAPLSFDIHVWQLLAPLLTGGQVDIFSREVAHDPVQLLERTARHHITILEVVPSLLTMMLDEMPHRPQPADLRWLIPTGEALPPEQARKWLERMPNTPLVNAYGPTECSDDVSHALIDQPPEPDIVNMPIGKPVINTRLYCLNPELEPVPLRVEGELFVTGTGVGRGYLNDPVKTAQIFVPDPFAATPGARGYKTGDLACHLPFGDATGPLEFRGRIDHQVKVRGFRIELGEIESAVRRYEGIKEALVLALGSHTNKRLVAYAVFNEQAADPEIVAARRENLRQFLRENLLDYMVPSAIVLMDAFPLTPNGKIDRKALPQDGLPMADTHKYVAPRNEMEQKLADIWCEVLELERVGVHDSFFDLGGHSLLAIKVIARIRQVLETDFSLRYVFQDPTIASLAERIETVTGLHAQMTAPVDELLEDEEEIEI